MRGDGSGCGGSGVHTGSISKQRPGTESENATLEAAYKHAYTHTHTSSLWAIKYYKVYRA